MAAIRSGVQPAATSAGSSSCRHRGERRGDRARLVAGRAVTSTRIASPTFSQCSNWPGAARAPVATTSSTASASRMVLATCAQARDGARRRTWRAPAGMRSRLPGAQGRPDGQPARRCGSARRPRRRAATAPEQTQGGVCGVKLKHALPCSRSRSSSMRPPSRSGCVDGHDGTLTWLLRSGPHRTHARAAGPLRVVSNWNSPGSSVRRPARSRGGQQRPRSANSSSMSSTAVDHRGRARSERSAARQLGQGPHCLVTSTVAMDARLRRSTACGPRWRTRAGSSPRPVS